MILNENNLCGFCDPTMIKNMRLAKQKIIKQLFDNKGMKYIIYDSTVDRSCGLERLDFVFDFNDRFIVVEVDEGSHKNYNCEDIRMINISQSLGMKTIFIKYNPNSYKVKGKKKNPTKRTRHRNLLKTIEYWSKLDSNKIPFLSTVHMYYDEYKPSTKANEIKIEKYY